MSDTVLKVNDVSMRFNLSKEKVDSLKEYIIKLLKGQLEFDEFWALENIDFQLEKGDRLGILGFNGAGKSTLLKVIAGVFQPTKGSIAYQICEWYFFKSQEDRGYKADDEITKHKLFKLKGYGNN